MSDDFTREHRELQRLLSRELRDYGPQPLAARDAEAVAWHLADVTLAVVVDAVHRERTQRR